MKVKAFTLLLILWGALFISCSNENELPVKADLDFNKIGEIHNAGLDYILKNLHIDEAVSRGSVSSEVREKDAAMYAQINELSVQYIAQLISEQDADVQSAFNQYGGEDKLLNVISLMEDDSLTVADAAKVLSKEANIYLKQYLRTIDANYDSDAEFQNMLENIGSIIADKFTSVEERMILLPATSVGEYSFRYWNENAWKWYTKFNVHGYEMSNPVRAKIWKSDVSGGIVAGLHLWFDGTGMSLTTLGSCGWTVIEMIIAGKALQASACALLVSVWYD